MFGRPGVGQRGGGGAGLGAAGGEHRQPPPPPPRDDGWRVTPARWARPRDGRGGLHCQGREQCTSPWFPPLTPPTPDPVSAPRAQAPTRPSHDRSGLKFVPPPGPDRGRDQCVAPGSRAGPQRHGEIPEFLRRLLKWGRLLEERSKESVKRSGRGNSQRKASGWDSHPPPSSCLDLT